MLFSMWRAPPRAAALPVKWQSSMVGLAQFRRMPPPALPLPPVMIRFRNTVSMPSLELSVKTVLLLPPSRVVARDPSELTAPSMVIALPLVFMPACENVPACNCTVPPSGTPSIATCTDCEGCTYNVVPSPLQECGQLGHGSWQSDKPSPSASGRASQASPMQAPPALLCQSPAI